MTDRELLEAAAKAAGYEIVYHAPYGEMMLRGIQDPWEPLYDDGDALRLAADLDLFAGSGYWTELAVARLKGGTAKYANVRRAIVCAAAALCPSS
jgi:hypothetical protein